MQKEIGLLIIGRCTFNDEEETPLINLTNEPEEYQPSNTATRA